MRLKDKVCIVTGSTSGIGKGIALEFARQGAKVLLTGRSEERANSVIEQAVADGAERNSIAFHAADLSDVEACQQIVPAAAERFGQLDVVVNNAGDFTRSTIENLTVEQWDRQMNLNLRAPFLITQTAVPQMKQRGGSIVNIGSMNAYVGELKLLAYSTTKGGLVTFTKNVANYLTRYRIRVNCINVGWTLTEGEHKIMVEDTGDENWLEGAEASRPLRQLLRPIDIAHAAVYFASDESRLVSGSVLDLEQQSTGAPTLPFGETVD